MSHAEVTEYLSQVGLWMATDIRREIQLAHVSRTPEGTAALKQLGVEPGGGNVLAALGLTVYTEALGLIRVWNEIGAHGRPEQCFLAFFDRMAGGRYKAWREQWEESRGGIRLYDALRSGLVHEYKPKVDSEFHIGDLWEPALEDSNGLLIFRVAPYHREFIDAVNELYADLMALADPQLPPPLTKSAKGFAQFTTNVSPTVRPTS